MAARPLTDEQAREALSAYSAALAEGHPVSGRGNRRTAARVAADRLGIDRNTFHHRLARAHQIAKTEEFEADPLPPDGPSTEELLAERKARFNKKRVAKQARKLIPVRVKLDGPIGIAHMGDPHVDDDGTDIELLERHIATINRTPGLFAANLGDNQNNWIGRLAHLWGQQSTSAREAWQLTEWLLKSAQWVYLIGGNHDCWSGEGDPIKWIMESQSGVYENWGARLDLVFPNGKHVRVNARHDFSGHSMWNPNHGPMKAAQGGWRDHILTCGHKHVSFVTGPMKDPASGLLTWAIRCAGYKTFDRYAEEKGLPDQNPFPSAVTIIDPRYADDDPRLVRVFADVEDGADYLNFLRRNAA